MAVKKVGVEDNVDQWKEWLERQVREYKAKLDSHLMDIYSEHQLSLVYMVWN